ncbi:MAG: hypothetical protein AAF502_10100 [Bacteroidota bacterium]
MKTLKFFFSVLVIALTINLQTAEAQLTSSSTPGAGVDWVQDWGTVSGGVSYSPSTAGAGVDWEFDWGTMSGRLTVNADVKKVLIDIPGEKRGRRLNMDLVNADIHNVFVMEANGNKIELETKDGKKYYPKSREHRSTFGFISIYIPSSSARGKKEIDVIFVNIGS